MSVTSNILFCCTLTVVSTTMFSCMEYSPVQLVRDYEKITYRKVIKRNGISLALSPLQPEYLAAREYVADTTKDLAMLVEKYSNAIYISVTAARDNKQIRPLIEVSRAGRIENDISQILFEKRQDFFMTHGKDTVKTEQCQFERNWETGDGSFFIAFKRSDITLSPKKYTLTIRNLWDELGTVCVPYFLANKRIRLKGI